MGPAQDVAGGATDVFAGDAFQRVATELAGRRLLQDNDTIQVLLLAHREDIFRQERDRDDVHDALAAKIGGN